MKEPVSYYEKNFDRADLRGFDFRGADLRRASFKYSRLEGALFYGAWMDEKTCFDNATLPYFHYFPEKKGHLKHSRFCLILTAPTSF